MIGRAEAEARSMLDTHVMRAFGLAVPGRVWRDVGATHPLGDDYNGLVQFLPESHDRPELDRAIAAVLMEVLTRGLLLWGTPEQAVRQLREFGDAGLSHVCSRPCPGWSRLRLPWPVSAPPEPSPTLCSADWRSCSRHPTRARDSHPPARARSHLITRRHVRAGVIAT